ETTLNWWLAIVRRKSCPSSAHGHPHPEDINLFLCLYRFSRQLDVIDTKSNWWGYGTTSAVAGRIRDQLDSAQLLEVVSVPFYLNNQTLLSGRCDPGYVQVARGCYIYVGGPMTYQEAKDYCVVR